MARPALRIEVSAKDQKELRKLVNGGVQQVRAVLRALDCSFVGRRIRQTQIGSAVGERNHPLAPAKPRSESVSGKKCGWSPISMTTISPRWKMFWNYTNGLMIRNSR